MTPNLGTRTGVGSAPDQAFASDLGYKLKTHVDIAWVQDSSGTIEPGSVYLSVDERLGSTQIAPFVLSFMNATQTDYGVPIPDLAFSEVSAHTYTNDATEIGNLLTVGYTPAQAYMPNTEAPQVDTEDNCVQIKSVDGGVDAYRPLDMESGLTDGAVSAWVGEIQSLATADDGSQYGLVYQGYMPDLYLYYDGKMVNQAGQSTETAVQSGNFANFSNIPLLISDAGNAYGYCNIEDRGNGGNPWDVDVPELTPTYV